VITCAEAVGQLWEYLDQTLEADRRASVEEHLSRCRTCCGEMEFAKELRLFLSGAAEERFPPDVLRRLHETIEELGR